VRRELWRQTRLEWLDSPVPASFRYALVDALAERAPWPWGPVADVAREMDVGSVGARTHDDWPAPDGRLHDEVLTLTVRLVLDGPAEDVRRRLMEILGERGYASLVGMLTYLETCRMFAQAHPGLAAAAGASAPETAGVGDERGPGVERPEAAGAAALAQLAFEGAPVGMALVRLQPDGAGVITEVNRALCVMTGRDSSDLVGLSLDDITEPPDSDLDADVLRRLLAGEIPSYEVTKRFRGAEGPFWGELSASLIRDDQSHEPIYLVIQLADVTERRRLEDALRTSRDRFQSVFDEAPIGMGLATLDYRWVQANDALCETLGYTEAELLSKRLEDLVARDEIDTIKRYLRQLMTGDVLGYHVETRGVRADGQDIWVQLSVSLLHDYGGAPTYVLAEVQEITERKRLEEELEQGTLIDAVTGLPSRALLFDRLQQARARLARHGSPFAVMFAQVNGLEDVGVRLGGERSDAALREIGARLAASVRPGDTVSRYSPDEFVILCEELEGENEAAGIAARILELGQFAVGDADLGLTIGLTVAANSDDSPTELVERADAAMHAAKGQGAGYHEYCDSV
jgi:PAS domain S-box-containing protein/diguanylate cyclase (GGDEF)-like protein